MSKKNVSTRKQLLFDDALIKRKSGFRIAMNPANRTGKVVMTGDQPWEQAGIRGDSGITVLEEGGLYKMWYQVPLSETARTDPAALKRLFPKVDFDKLDVKTRNDMLSRSRMMLCHATSEDGTHWKKPKLGIIEVAGSKRNNAVITGRIGGTVFIDPTARKRDRFKLIFGGGPRLPHRHCEDPDPRADIYHAIYGATSPDGIHWNATAEPIVPWYTDSTNVGYWDDRIRKYVAFMRWNQDMVYRDGQTVIVKPGGWKYRAVGRSEAEDFFDFPPPAKVSEPSKAEREPRHRGIDYYNSSAVKYAFADDAYFMFSSDYNSDNGMLDVHLATSRDGVKYKRWIEPFLGVGPTGAFDSQCTYMATGMFHKGNELWMYYLGRDTPHTCHRYPEGRKRSPGSSAVGLARVRLDGFVSQDATASGGEMITEPISFEGRRLEVNMDAGARGWLKVEILNARGRPCRGFSEKDADPVWGNDVKKVMTWKGSKGVSDLKGRPVRLRFIGKSVKVYAFQFK